MITPGSHTGLIAFGALYIMARAFANGGSSLTGIEAVSNAVSALRPPEGATPAAAGHPGVPGRGADRRHLLAGHATHVTPFTRGFPTLLAQEAGLVFGHGATGHLMFFVLQAGTAAILFTGGNTSFTGFPFLASFVPRTPSCRAGSPCAASGWCSPTASSCSPYCR